jgi:hypothetical protein
MLSLTGCNLSTTEVADQPTDPATETFAPNLQVNIATMTKTTAGTYYRDLVAGRERDRRHSDDHPVVSGVLEGWHAGQGREFRATTSRRADPGLKDAMQGMRVPEAASHRGALGAWLWQRDNRSSIPPNSTLVFDVIFKGYPTQPSNGL